MDTSMFPSTLTESADEARRAILPQLVKNPELAEKVSNLQAYDGNAQVKTFPHHEDGGTYHNAGRLKTAFPMHLMVCDVCGSNFTSR